MRKISYIFLGILICLAALSATFVYRSLQSDNTDPVESDLETIKNLTDMFEDELEDFGIEKEMIDEAIAKIEEFNAETKHVVTFDIQNETNPIFSTTLNLPVSEEFYDSIKIGERVSGEDLEKVDGLAQFDNSFDGWVLVIKDKTIRD